MCPQWGNTDDSANTPQWTPSLVKLDAGNTDHQANLFGNSTADAFITGATIGVYGVDTTEAQWEQWELFGVSPGSNVGDGVVLTGNSTTGFQVNGGTASVTAVINVDTLCVSTVGPNTAAGQGFTNGDVVEITGSGTGSHARFTVTANATGNVTALTVVAGYKGDYTVFPNATANTTAITGSGNSLIVDITAGVGQVSVSNGGTFTALPSVIDDNAVTEQGDQTNTTVTLNLGFRKTTTPIAHSGYVMVTEGSGGRAGRITSETLIATSSLSGDDEDTVFPNT
jgi:hypothetical protein